MLDGNALGNTPQVQLDLVRNTAAHAVDMVEEGVNVIAGHGNGPQVGMMESAFDYASAHGRQGAAHAAARVWGHELGLHRLPAVAAPDQRAKRRGIMRSSARSSPRPWWVRTTRRSRKSPAPVGARWWHPYFRCASWSSTPSNTSWARATSWCPREAAACWWSRDGGYRGVSTVIDKDRSSALLAADFKVDLLVILTVVPKVTIFNTPDQRDLDVMKVAEAARYIKEGRFASGTMLPKVEACIAYLEAHPEGKAIITSLESAAEAVHGDSGTLITA